MKGWPKFQIDSSTPGELTYREGYRVYRFPLFQENGVTVFVNEPTYQRLFLYFLRGGWDPVPGHLEPADSERITACVRDELRQKGAHVRVMARDWSEAGLVFHPELFEART